MSLCVDGRIYSVNPCIDHISTSISKLKSTNPYVCRRNYNRENNYFKVPTIHLRDILIKVVIDVSLSCFLDMLDRGKFVKANSFESSMCLRIDVSSHYSKI